jgi:hypothetical protein
VAFAAVAAALDQLSGHAVSKMSTEGEVRDSRGAARAALGKRLIDISRAAAVIADEAPGFDKPFYLSKKRQPDQALVTAGRLFIQHAEAGKSRFVELGMAESCVTELTSLVDAFEQAIQGREAGRDGQTAARAGITSALASGLAAVRRLDVIVGIQFAGDPVVMAVWERDRKVDIPPRRRKPASPESPQATKAGAKAGAVTPATDHDVVESKPTAAPSTLTPVSPESPEAPMVTKADIKLPIAS